MINKSILKFENYFINEITFSKNEEFNIKNPIELDLDFSYNFTEKENKTFVKLTLKIFDENYIQNQKPFFMKVSITGIFQIENYDTTNKDHKNLISKNTLTILFPYLRSTITHISLEAQINPIIIPPINIQSYFEK
ncbi:MAG: hypothetical protein A2086_00625 [Spirochaetes bacterium GWD1_27_9]|nr:MAG: hypothetical protein A2Z98_05135 [Spirochaetes bacterium GWB1_27_13]OHD32514.1 MAG: hypothetical protein A2086_00625 [Spirochaetes bacterium GWD1_27_9]